MIKQNTSLLKVCTKIFFQHLIISEIDTRKLYKIISVEKSGFLFLFSFYVLYCSFQPLQPHNT